MKISPWTLARLNAAAQARRKSKILQPTQRHILLPTTMAPLQLEAWSSARIAVSPNSSLDSPDLHPSHQYHEELQGLSSISTCTKGGSDLRIIRL
ncbi:hypothetical protein B296_00043988 [Ensete ventricosum]|uniref:Uncharacterized protein n=1 Tax=Ensete ventricosum TaxID=4639 RepID=A0A426Y5M6_ENSVE|nr:hypothetical protein B296_00043988 [Ensete ventricosum]